MPYSDSQTLTFASSFTLSCMLFAPIPVRHYFPFHTFAHIYFLVNAVDSEFAKLDLMRQKLSEALEERSRDRFLPLEDRIAAQELKAFLVSGVEVDNKSSTVGVKREQVEMLWRTLIEAELRILSEYDFASGLDCEVTFLRLLSLPLFFSSSSSSSSLPLIRITLLEKLFLKFPRIGSTLRKAVEEMISSATSDNPTPLLNGNNSKKSLIVLVGPPGSGKTTLTHLLSSSTPSFLSFSLGALIRHSPLLFIASKLQGGHLKRAESIMSELVQTPIRYFAALPSAPSPSYLILDALSRPESLYTIQPLLHSLNLPIAKVVLSISFSPPYSPYASPSPSPSSLLFR